MTALNTAILVCVIDLANFIFNDDSYTIDTLTYILAKATTCLLPILH